MWAVENVKPYYKPLITPTIKLGRHLVWSNFSIKEMDFNDGLTNNERGMHDRGVFDLRPFKMTHRKDQIIRNCVVPELGQHILEAGREALNHASDFNPGCNNIVTYGKRGV